MRDSAAQRRQQLLLEAADRQHPAAQRHLAGHRDVAANRRSPVRVEIIAVTMPMPADGPSLGTAPSGKWTWMSLRAKIDGLTP